MKIRRHKIDILTRTISGTNKDGVPIEEWNKLTEVPIWASIRDEGGSEFYAGNADYELERIKVNISFRTDVTRKMRVLFHEKVYEIVRVYNGDYRNGSLDFDAERRSNEDGKIHC